MSPFNDNISGISGKITSLGDEFIESNQAEVSVAPTPDSINWESEPILPFPISGLLGYIFPTGVSDPIHYATEWKATLGFGGQFVAGQKTPAIIASRTPFNSSSFSDPPSDIALSQFLFNKIVEADLGMKFKNVSLVSDGSQRIFINWDGVPQLYWWTGSNFQFLGRKVFPQDLIYGTNPDIPKVDSDNATDFLLHVAINDAPFFSRLDCILAPGGASVSEFSNSSFVLRPNSSGEFLFPSGDLIFVNGTDVSFCSVGDPSGYQGARIKVAIKIGVGGVKIFEFSPVGRGSTIQDSVTRISYKAGQTLKKSAKKVRFVSPFLEMTLERLFDFPLPPWIGGNLTNAQKDLKRPELGNLSMPQAAANPPSGEKAVSNIAERMEGRAVNICPANLLAVSGSMVKFQTGAAGFYVQLRALLNSLNPVQINKGAKIQHNYSDGTSELTEEVVFSLGISKDDNDHYTTLLQPNDSAEKGPVINPFQTLPNAPSLPSGV